MELQEIYESFPAEETDDIAALEEETVKNDNGMIICVAGAFSTGKTTLVNNLIGEQLLPTAIEESTALPTFLGYADKRDFQVVFNDKAEEIQTDDLRRLALKPPAGARFLNIGLPLAWLAGCQLVDLPGTSGNDPVKQEYARQLMRQADAIIYLLSQRGPTNDDLENLRQLHKLGKKTLVCVSHWDVIDECAKRGEKTPDLESWQKEIAYNTGIDQPLVAVSIDGMGLKEILAFLGDTLASLETLRSARFTAELMPLLASKLEQKKQAKNALSAQTEEERHSFHTRLMQEKETLLKLRGEVNEERNKDIEKMLAKWQEGSQKISERLNWQLGEAAEEWTTPEGQEKFLQQGQTALASALDDAARIGRDLSENYGAFEISLGAEANANLYLTPPPALAAADFIDAAQMGKLETQVTELLSQIAQAENTEAAPADGPSASDIVMRIAELENKRQQIMSLPMPVYEEDIAQSSAGRQIGRLVGEIADVALLVLWPFSAATKAGSIVSKGAKAIGIGAKTARMAGKLARETAKAAKNAHNFAVSGKGLPPQFVEKMGMLDMLTLGYWGEKLGSMFDTPPARVKKYDQEEIGKRNAEVSQLELEQQKLRMELHSLEFNAKKSGPNKAELQSRLDNVKKQMRELEEEAENRRKEAAEQSEKTWLESLSYAKQRQTAAWKRSLEMQLSAMRELLLQLIRDWWDNYIPKVLADKQENIKLLLAQLETEPAERKTMLEKIQKQIAILEKFIGYFGEKN